MQDSHILLQKARVIKNILKNNHFVCKSILKFIIILEMTSELRRSYVVIMVIFFKVF